MVPTYMPTVSTTRITAASGGLSNDMNLRVRAEAEQIKALTPRDYEMRILSGTLFSC